MTKEKITVTFAPGSFDSFDGTQEELDEMIAEITRMAESGELFDQSQTVDFDELMELDPEYAEKILNAENMATRILQ